MADRPNIVWLTLDSVRADHTTLFGYGRETTQNLQRIADRSSGSSISNCFAHSNWTRCSTASIITGTYPSHHGVGMYTGDEAIPPQLDTVAELLSEQGYRTGCLSRNVNSTMGFDRGFDRFEWISAQTLPGSADPRSLIKYLLNIRRHSAGFSTDTAKHATPFLLNDMAKRWIRSFAGSEDPFFLYMHYNEPHRPYYPPLPYLDRFADDLEMSASEAAEFAVDVHYNLEKAVAGGCDFSDDEWAALYAMYDAEIAYTDERVGRLFDYIESLGLDNTVFVITADHGELFGEGGMLAHKILLHDALIHVPMVVHGLDEMSTADQDLVQHADVMEVLVDRAGGRTEQFQGIDPREESREYVISQRGEEAFDDFLEHDPDFDTSRYHSAPLTCLRTHEFKFQRSEEREELFALPDERTDVSQTHPDTASRLGQELAAWLEADGRPLEAAGRVETSDAMKEQLRDLGYLG